MYFGLKHLLVRARQLYINMQLSCSPPGAGRCRIRPLGSVLYAHSFAGTRFVAMHVCVISQLQVPYGIRTYSSVTTRGTPAPVRPLIMRATHRKATRVKTLLCSKRCVFLMISDYYVIIYYIIQSKYDFIFFFFFDYSVFH